ncbi:hypothetical protein PENSPDRAFT_757893 [Peniophora sp. CONT]|nr:hypothetical protein PENSPDRAFT_757893 [Peniophora sp. CONT]
MAPGSLDYWSNAKEARLLHLGLSAGVATQQPREISDSLYDQEIAALSKVMSSLKTARNARAPIYKLPDDILLDIFMVVEGDSMPPHGPSGHNLRGAAQLMQHIPSCETFTALQRLVIQHPPRTMSAHDGPVIFHEAGPDTISRIVSWLSGLLPQLREVSLCRSVALSPTSVVFQSVLPVHLTSLCINQEVRRNFDLDNIETVSNLLSFLRRSTGLKTLVLRNVLPITLARHLAGTEPISLLQLERLELSDHVDPCSYMLNIIRYPVKCSIAVEAEGGETTQYSILWPHVLASADGRSSSLRLEQEERTIPGGNADAFSFVQVTFLPPLHAPQNSEGMGSHKWRFRCPGTPTKLICTLLSLIPLIDTQRLTFKGPVQLSAPDWHASLSKPSSIQTLVIHSVKSGGYNLCVALGFSTADSSAPQTSPGILLPLLTRWELHNCDLELLFRVDAPEHGVSMAVGEYRPLSWFLLRTMRARVEADVVPRQFVLANCSKVTESWVEEMKAAVPEEMRDWDFDAWLGQAKEDGESVVLHSVSRYSG